MAAAAVSEECSYCRSKGRELEDCSKAEWCQLARYCSKECGDLHYFVHKTVCGDRKQSQVRGKAPAAETRTRLRQLLAKSPTEEELAAELTRDGTLAYAHQFERLRIEAIPLILLGRSTEDDGIPPPEEWHAVLERSPPPKDHLRILCISDTHTYHDSLQLPPADVLIHAGDFTRTGKDDEIASFFSWFSSLDQFKHKIVVAGNHDIGLYGGVFPGQSPVKQPLPRERVERCQAIARGASNVAYLEDEEYSVVVGDHSVRIWGSPWQPEYKNWAFNAIRGADIQQHWDKIPEGIDILVVHGPPLGYGDLVKDQVVRSGCYNLLTTLETRVKPRAVVFGHVHESYGAWSNGSCIFINASTCDIRLRPTNPPIIFDYPLPR